MSNQGTKCNITFLFIHPWQQFAITQPPSTLAGSLVTRRMNTKWMEKQCRMVVEWILVSREYLLLSCSRQCRFQNRLHLMSCSWCIWVSCEIYVLFSMKHFFKARRTMHLNEHDGRMSKKDWEQLGVDMAGIGAPVSCG